jgi:signal transduction histidine kinase
MAASHAAVLAVILVVLGGSGLLVLARSLDQEATEDLTIAAKEQVGRILQEGGPLPAPDSDLPSSVETRVAVYAADGSLVGEPAETPSWLHPYTRAVVDLRVAGEPVRVVTVPAIRNGNPVATVVVGRSLRSDDRLIERVRTLLVGGGIIAILASIAAGWWLAGRAVRPVQRAYEAQAGFAADASHELRTPLTFIRSGVEVMAERDRELGGQVLEEVDYLTGLTQRLLMLARAERGTLSLDHKPFSVGDLCRSTVRRSERASGTRVSISPGGELEAAGDRIAAEAALDALLENLGVHGGGRGVLSWSGAGGRVTISLADDGPGLAPELTDRAFERFFRADPSRTRDTGGAGLGLPLTRALVEAQGGRVWLEPSPGGGLTARLELPLARSDDRRDAAAGGLATEEMGARDPSSTGERPRS